MRHHLFSAPAESYPVALLMKSSAFDKTALITNYIDQFVAHGMAPDNVIAFTLSYNEVGKAPVKHIKEYLELLLPELTSLKTEYLYVTDSNYFKVLVGQTKAEVHGGYVMPCAIKGYEHMKIVLGINYQSLIYNPALQVKLETGIYAIVSAIKGVYQAPGTGIIHQEIYPEGIQAIQEALNALHSYDTLTADIEAFSLRFNEAGIGTIAFAPDQHRFVAFPCDYKPNVPDIPMVENRKEYGRFVPNPVVREMLKHFFTTYQGKLIWHNTGYDLKVLIYTLWMKDYGDTAGLLEGLNIMTRLFDDTKIIAYLATNSTAGNVLGLKPLAHEFAGNYAQDDIKDIKLIPLDKLLRYNGVDCLSTFFVYNKYRPIMIADNQQHLHETMMLPSQKLILQIELTGMPMNAAKIALARKKLETEVARVMAIITAHPFIIHMDLVAQTKAMEAANAKLKTKQHPLSKYADLRFNPGSDPQMRHLLYEVMQLPVIDRTDTKMPATGGKTIKKLINHTDDPSWKELLVALMDFANAEKVLSSFIPAFEKAIARSADGIVWLHGSFNIGGTVSGRLSSSDPNLQNIPAKSVFAKIIKECFMGPEGWLFCGADFNSLEDYISALTTKDPNKLKVYTDGFDGHCLRAAYYYKDELVAEGINIDITDPKSVNSLKKMGNDGHWTRQESKVPTFALTYQGTKHTLMANLGWTDEKASRIEKSYHELYVVSDQYIQDRLKQANKDGYVEVAFGLRVRTPMIKQVIWGSSRMPFEAAAEGRTAGNAMGQSYGLLNNRAAVDFMQKVWASKYRYDILPCALIHDAIYLIVREDAEVVEWANRELILSMQWQELPEIQHPTVKLGAALDIFWPSWANAITLPNNATQEEIIVICQKGKHDYLNPKPKE